MEKYNDLKNNKGIYHSEALVAWHNMHYRVSNILSYGNVTICSEWYTFSNFYKWFSTNYVENWHLDKDIKGGSEYSPQHCVFVPTEVNQLFRNVSTTYAKGVAKNNDGYQAQITINGVNKKLGTYKTIEEATEAYQVARAERLNELTNQYPTLANIIN